MIAQVTIVVACGAFKGSLTAAGACAAAARGVRRARPEAEVLECPVADGGDGSLDVVVSSGAQEIPVTVHGPTGQPVASRFAAVDPDTAFVEMADTCGLLRLPGGVPAPLTASSRGLGEAVLAALSSGRGNIHLGIGGSASTDGGTGMLSALGVRFLDARGEVLPDGGGALVDLERIDLAHVDPVVRMARFHLACDVDNPLLGPKGAARVYGPQKGADDTDIARLEAGLARLVEVARRQGIPVDPEHPGAGAAGGVGFAAHSALHARIRQGFDAMAQITGLEARVSAADLVVTGEGRLDDQTMHGKAPMGVAMMGVEHAVPVVAVCGRLDLEADRVAAAGFAAATALLDRVGDLETSTREAATLLEDAVAELLAARVH